MGMFFFFGRASEASDGFGSGCAPFSACSWRFDTTFVGMDPTPGEGGGHPFLGVKYTCKHDLAETLKLVFRLPSQALNPIKRKKKEEETFNTSST